MRSRLRWLLAFVVVWLAVGCTQLPTVQPGISLPDAGLLPDTEQPLFVLFYTDN
ncbi:MAG: hypothetical protein M9918_23115 [Anaerolineae bacterium]|nr:hypothetical protein [Anaerolineae bacterium]MCO5191066.1 hypothetical protein [Anaerolineae bacterium]MCO5196050.1 hypothetical protein [Anaerolineae bacterium]